MNPYRLLSWWRSARAVRRGRVPQRVWNIFLGRGIFRIMRKYFK